MEPIEGKIRILIVDDVPEGREGLARLLSFEPDMDVIGFASTGAEALDQAQDLKPDVILMDINMPDMDGITATEKITKLVPTSVIMISVQSDRDYMRRAMQVGAMDFLPKPPSADELYATVRNAYIRKPKPTMIPGKRDSDDGGSKHDGKVIVVYSPQGGAGATTLAVNIASGIMDEQHRTVLIDANLQFGDVAVHLAMRNERNILDLAKSADDLDIEVIENVLGTHGTGLRLLAAPQKPQEAELVTPAGLVKIIEALSQRFGYVIVDTSLHLDDISLNLFDIADLLVFVGVPTLPCVRNIRVVLDLLSQFEDFDQGKIFFVMNKVPTDRKSGALDPEAIAKTLKIPIQATIPSSEKQMLDSLVRGVPAIVNARQSPGREINQMVELVEKALQDEDAAEPVEQESTGRRGRMGRLGGR